MKTLFFSLTLSAVIFLSACTQEAAKQETTKTAASKKEILTSIYTDIVQPNANKAAKQCHTLEQTLNENSDLSDIRSLFSSLVRSWKKVEAQYILAELSNEAIDLPRFIDVYRIGNEDLNKQLARALKSSSKPSTALFKHSQKTITALEFMLFNDENFNPRKRELSQFIAHNLCQRFDRVTALYEQHLTDFISNEDKATALLLNTLIDSSYKLREWRVGDALGLSRKYQGTPDISRFEYEQSQLSVLAIQAILEAHSELMLEGDKLNFADLISLMGAKEPLKQNQKSLQQANLLTQQIDSSQSLMAKGEPLFNELDKLHISYYSSLVKSLDVVAKILEADGD